MKFHSHYLLIFIFLWACSEPQPADNFESIDDLEILPEGLYNPDWLKNATIYEANIRQHTPEGTFKSLELDLERISDMGISILWLMPVHPIGEVNRKGGKGSYYSVKDYKGLNPEFGNAEDFRSLIEEAHRQDMAVIIDWVANHTAFDAVWTIDHKDWYQLDSLGKLQPPAGTDWTDVAALDYANQEMRNAMIDAMAYWIREFDIDGFRCDVASYVPTDFWETCVDSLRNINPEIFMLAEAEAPELHDKAFNAGYAWEWLHIINGVAKGEKTIADIDTYMAQAPDSMRNGAFKMYFTTNHDENSWNGTVFERFGDPGHLAYTALTYTIDGMPLVYSGQEAGLNKALAFFEKDQVDWGDYKYQDFYSKLLMLNKVNPALWTGEHGGAFKRLRSNADTQVYAFSRTNDQSQVITICNLSDERVKLRFEDELPGGDFRPLFGEENYELIGKNGLELAPFEFHIFYK
jgi:glycosidase